MICKVCGEEGQGSAMEYRLGGAQSCPAMSCNACGAILLEEDSARTDQERESVREVISTRNSISESPANLEARERETSRPPGPSDRD